MHESILRMVSTSTYAPPQEYTTWGPTPSNQTSGSPIGTLLAPPGPYGAQDNLGPSPAAPFSLADTAGRLHSFSSAFEYLDILDRHLDEAYAPPESSSLLVVLYYAPYCKLCQRASMVLNQLAERNLASGRPGGPVYFTRLDASLLLSTPHGETADEHSDASSVSSIVREKLGISRLPFVHIYRQGKCIASFSSPQSHRFRIQMRENLDLCQRRSLMEWDEWVHRFEKEIAINQEARQELRYCLPTR